MRCIRKTDVYVLSNKHSQREFCSHSEPAALAILLLLFAASSWAQGQKSSAATLAVPACIGIRTKRNPTRTRYPYRRSEGHQTRRRRQAYLRSGKDRVPQLAGVPYSLYCTPSLRSPSRATMSR